MSGQPIDPGVLSRALEMIDDIAEDALRLGRDEEAIDRALRRIIDIAFDARKNGAITDGLKPEGE